MFPNFIRNFLISQIRNGAKTALEKRNSDALRVVRLALGDGEHRELHRREPQREGPRVVLDQDAEKALHRADDGAVEHDRRVARVVVADVLRAEAPGHAEVDLHGAALPDAADAVLERVLDLWPVERTLARGQLGGSLVFF